jgi:diguanylate cyclase (GGDEF)-like protein
MVAQMVAAFLKRLRTLRQRMPAQYISPVMLLLGTCFASIFLLLLLSTRTQDTMQRQRETEALSRAMHITTLMVQHDLQDYAKWDDAVRHISRGVEQDWVSDNIVAYLGRTQSYSHIFILDAADRTVYSFDDAKPAADLARRRLGRDFVDTLGEVRRMSRQGSPIAGGYGRAGNRVVIYSAAAVVPLTGKVTLPAGPTHMLVIGRDVDDVLLAQVTRELQLQNLHLRLDKPADDRTAIPITEPDGHPVAWIEWTPHRPGMALRRQLAPAIIVMALLAVLAAILILQRANRSMEALRQSEMRARHHAHHDLLTGLPNRRALIDAISEGLSARSSLSLIYMDLDGFKDANDVYGHAAGDLLLSEAAGRIRTTVPGVLVARAGGDEFAVLFVDAPGASVARACGAILEAFRQPFAIGAYRLTIGISIGCARSRSLTVEDHDELMRRADVAMYAAKAEGKHCARSYSPALDAGHLMRVRLEKDLQASVAAGEIFVLYQPIVDAATKSIVAVEALARWNHPEHGDVPPDVFIPIAEMSGLINEIGRQVLQQACHAMRHIDVDLAVNLSPAQFWDGALLRDVIRVLEETGFPAKRLELEITESLLLSRPEKATKVIDGLRSLGIKIALDDFGTGFASIGYLQKLTFDRIKIDKVFVGPLGHEAKAREMMNSIVGLARAFDLEVSAEGVETIMQSEISRLAGCNRLQGWLFGRPVPIGEIRYLIDNMREDARRSA